MLINSITNLNYLIDITLNSRIKLEVRKNIKYNYNKVYIIFIKLI